MKFIISKNTIVTAAFVLSAVSPALAQTLGERKQLTRWNEQIAQEKTNNFVKKCGYDIAVTMDPKIATPFMEATASGSGYCIEALIAMGRMCEDAESKKAIVEKIKKLDCKLGSKPDAAFKLSGGTLTFEFTTQSANLSDATKKFLENSL